MSKQRLPVELAYFVPEPAVILFGCRPLVPYRPGWHDRPAGDQHFHAPKRAAVPGDRPWPAAHCPACRGMIGRPRENPLGHDFVPEIDHRTYCELCGSMDSRNEANIRAQRINGEARQRLESADRQVQHALNSAAGSAKKRPRLTEVERRRIWNGYKGGILAASLEVTNRAKIGREFLTRIGQEPDWSLILDGSGRVVGVGPDGPQ